MKKRLVFAILVMGFSGLVAQILLLREWLVTSYGNELSIGIILANWLILEAIGAFFLGKRVERLRKKLQGFVCLQIVFSLSLPLAVYLTRILKEVIGATPGEGLGLIPLLYSSFLILLPVSISHGALFTFACKIYASHSKQHNATGIGKVYIYETLGTIVGGVAFTYLLIPYFHSFQIALSVALLNFALCLFLLGPFWQKGQIMTTKILASVSLIFLFLSAFLISGEGVDKIHWSSITKQWRGEEVVHYQNSIYGNVAVTRREEQYTFFSDGIPVITTPTPDIIFVEEFVHLPMLFHPQPKEVLIISGGAGGLISEVLKHPVERVDYVEIDPLLLEVVKKFPTPLTEAELNDPRVNIEYIDGRLFAKKTSRKYDLILVGLSNPQDLQVNRLFTKEFFFLVRNRLKEQSILVMSLPGSLSYLSEELKNLNSCILNTLKEVYPHIRIIPGDSTNLFLASLSPEVNSLAPSQLSKRLEERNLNLNLILPGYIEYKLHPRWLNWFLDSLKGGTEKTNQDFEPLGVFYSLSYWNALFSPSMRGLFTSLGKVNLSLFFIPIVFFTLGFLLFGSKIKNLPRATIPICIATTGFAGMIFYLALIFSFQALYGYVFYWIGLLVTALMVGIGVGSLRITLLLERIKKDISLFLKIELAIILFSLILPAVFFILRAYLDRPAVFFPLQIIFLLLSFLSGLLIGAEFPLANKIYLGGDSNLGKTAGLLYSADLFGGWIGGIIGGVVLLPVLGLLQTCMLVVMLKLSSFLILASSARREDIRSY